MSGLEVIRNYSLPRTITSYQIFCQKVLDVEQNPNIYLGVSLTKKSLSRNFNLFNQLTI